jgi:hypothetical protein
VKASRFSGVSKEKELMNGSLSFWRERDRQREREEKRSTDECQDDQR